MQGTAQKIDCQTSRGILPVFPEDLTIPKAIYQVYTNPALTPVLEENIRSIKALNPGWNTSFLPRRASKITYAPPMAMPCSTTTTVDGLSTSLPG